VITSEKAKNLLLLTDYSRRHHARTFLPEEVACFGTSNLGRQKENKASLISIISISIFSVTKVFQINLLAPEFGI